MIQFFVLQIKLGKITLEQVPEKWRDAVSIELNNH